MVLSASLIVAVDELHVLTKSAVDELTINYKVDDVTIDNLTLDDLTWYHSTSRDSPCTALTTTLSAHLNKDIDSTSTLHFSQTP